MVQVSTELAYQKFKVKSPLSGRRDLVYYLKTCLDETIPGEANNKILALLLAIGNIMLEPQHVVITSHSPARNISFVKSVLQLVPPELINVSDTTTQRYKKTFQEDE